MKVRAPELFIRRKRWPSPRFEVHLLANPSVCPAILAADLGSTEAFIRMCQRKMGLRKIASRPGRRTA